VKNGNLITGKREVNHRIPKSIQSIFSHAPLFYHNLFLNCVLIILPHREGLNKLFQSRAYINTQFAILQKAIVFIASCKIGTGSFPGVKSGRGVTLTPHSLLVPWSGKSRAIPLLPLWAVRPVQSLSTCTTVRFTLAYGVHENLLFVHIWYTLQIAAAYYSTPPPPPLLSLFFMHLMINTWKENYFVPL